MPTCPTYPELRGKTAFVTGASGGIGAETCRWLASNGVRVVANGRNEAALAKVVDDIGRAAGEAFSVVADCTDSSALKDALSATEDRFGQVDLLVAFAGGSTSRPAPVEETNSDDWANAIEQNLTATFLTIKTFLPGMKARRSGAIVTMASAAGRDATKATPGYATAKAGVIMLTRHLALEVAALGVRANCLSPSTILHDRTERHIPPATREAIAAQHPISRLGTPADIAAAALFLLSDGASWITGATLDIGGGRYMH